MTTTGWLPAPVEELFGPDATAEESYEVLTVDVPPATWLASLESARDALGCTYFDWLSAVDEPGTGFRVSAHVVALAPVRRLLVRTTVPHSAPVLPSAVEVYAGAAWHERETHEMFGVAFEGHPGLDPLLLPDGFEGHPLRKDFVLAARVAKAWPGAKEPGESEHGGPKRRQMLPPGVPDPNEWGPLKGQLPPAPARPARGAPRTPGDRPVRRARTAGEGSASQTATRTTGTPAAGTPAAGTPAAGTPAAGTLAAGTTAAGTTATEATAVGTPAAGAQGSGAQTPASASAGAGAPTAATPAPVAPASATPAATEPESPSPGSTAKGSATPASEAADPATTGPTSAGARAVPTGTTPDAPAASTASAESAASAEPKTPAEPSAPAEPKASAEPKTPTASRGSDAPWHHARPAFDEPGQPADTGATAPRSQPVEAPASDEPPPPEEPSAPGETDDPREPSDQRDPRDPEGPDSPTGGTQ
ncbi:NADH-quinone oxidoreductase subunit C [Streptomyces sp. NPDC057298]|uniref:NADH-quinone oxidoreductase subunit C n=1 Tax=Streptomyces sp. NPDC057298 TaxID=3346091 RepID=UPI003640F8CC